MATDFEPRTSHTSRPKHWTNAIGNFIAIRSVGILAKSHGALKRGCSIRRVYFFRHPSCFASTTSNDFWHICIRPTCRREATRRRNKRRRLTTPTLWSETRLKIAERESHFPGMDSAWSSQLKIVHSFLMLRHFVSRQLAIWPPPPPHSDALNSIKLRTTLN